MDAYRAAFSKRAGRWGQWRLAKILTPSEKREYRRQARTLLKRLDQRGLAEC